MKRIFSILLVCFLTLPTFAQMKVKSFKQLDNDMSARVTDPEIDQNGKKCAIVKVVTTEQGFSFDVGMLGIQKVVQKTAEIWVYASVGATKIKIMHPRWGQLETDTGDGYYWFPTGSLKEATVYRLELLHKFQHNSDDDEDEIPMGFLVITSEPSDAKVYITNNNGVEDYVGTTPYQNFMPQGTYYFRLAQSLYHDERGIAELASEKLTIPVPLRPAFGALHVTSQPSGATVILDEDKEYTTPCTIEKVASGNHTVQWIMNRYSPETQRVTIEDGKTKSIDVKLQARFAPITIKSIEGASLYINDTQVGTTQYTAELMESVYNIEARLASHTTAKKQVQVIANQPQTVELTPLPIYGGLVVMTEPIEANVNINGKNYGTSPVFVKKILIGDYTMTLSKAGCASVTKTFTIEEGKTTNITESLPTGKEITITTGASGDKVYIDNQYVGLSPMTQALAFGEHSFYAERNGKRCTAKSLNVTQTSATSVNLSFTQNITCTANGVSFEMVYVEGGTFTMGCTNEQSGDCDSDESPAHKVTLSDYYIGKYEVTQALWKAVMGSNPSRYTSSMQNPVENVSWNDCQEFISKLNTICHKNGTLPLDKNFYLPTEAQWEYAARGGKKSKEYKYSGSNNINDVAWYTNNSSNTTHAVGTKLPNELGLYDMSGNVWEWCSDWKGSYSSNSQTNPTGASSGSSRVDRGGSWYSSARSCRVANRDSYSPDYRNNFLGLRLSVH